MFLAAALTVTSSCGPKRVTVDGQDMSYEQGAEYLYRLGHQAQDAGDLTNAKKRYRDLVNDFDTSNEAPDARAELANIALAEGGCAAALVELERIVERLSLIHI